MFLGIWEVTGWRSWEVTGWEVTGWEVTVSTGWEVTVMEIITANRLLQHENISSSPPGTDRWTLEKSGFVEGS